MTTKERIQASWLSQIYRLLAEKGGKLQTCKPTFNKDGFMVWENWVDATDGGPNMLSSPSDWRVVVEATKDSESLDFWLKK